ncbi:transcriptional repressor for phenylacetic acid degradation [Streptomyces sp. e14]|nr:transcriptional repressor for phenylacetic acid degradation [Streptomyces sp. e14]
MINVFEQSAQPAPRSLIVTLYGAYGRFVPGPVPVAELIRLLAAVGVDAPSVRSSVSRLKRRGLLLPARTGQGAAGYELSPQALQLLEDGDRRVYAGAPGEDEGWVLAVFSVPESQRQKRHVLRSRLAGLGFGTAAPGCGSPRPGCTRKTRNTLRRLDLDVYVDFLPRRPPGVRADGPGGGPLVGPDGPGRAARGVPRPARAGAARLGGTRRHPAGGGVPGLSARPGLLAASPLRRPGPARPAAARELAGRPLGGRVPGAARAAARGGRGLRGGVRSGRPGVTPAPRLNYAG